MYSHISEKEFIKLLLKKDDPKTWEYYKWRIHNLVGRGYDGPDGFHYSVYVQHWSPVPAVRKQGRSMKKHPKAKGCKYVASFFSPRDESRKIKWPKSRKWRCVSKREGHRLIENNPDWNWDEAWKFREFGHYMLMARTNFQKKSK